MMIGRKTVLALCGATFIGMAGLAQAQEATEEPQGPITTDAGDSQAERADQREEYRNMTPEDREAHRQEKRDRWEAMSTEEQEAHRQQMKERWDELSPEEREAMKERKHKRRGDKTEGRDGRTDRARQGGSEQ